MASTDIKEELVVTKRRIWLCEWYRRSDIKEKSVVEIERDKYKAFIEIELEDAKAWAVLWEGTCEGRNYRAFILRAEGVLC